MSDDTQTDDERKYDAPSDDTQKAETPPSNNMRRRLIIGIAIASLVVLVYAYYTWKPADPRIKKIKEMGGEVVVDGNYDVGEVKTVKLGGAKFGDADMVHLADWSKLSSLNLNGTQITDKGLALVPKLTTLGATGYCAITDAGLEHLPNLISLTVSPHTEISDEARARIRERRRQMRR